MHYKPEVILTSVCNIAALTGSPNQRPSEFGEGRVLLMNKFREKSKLKKLDTIGTKSKIRVKKYN